MTLLDSIKRAAVAYDVEYNSIAGLIADKVFSDDLVDMVRAIEYGEITEDSAARNITFLISCLYPHRRVFAADLSAACEAVLNPVRSHNYQRGFLRITTFYDRLAPANYGYAVFIAWHGAVALHRGPNAHGVYEDD